MCMTIHGCRSEPAAGAATRRTATPDTNRGHVDDPHQAPPHPRARESLVGLVLRLVRFDSFSFIPALPPFFCFDEADKHSQTAKYTRPHLVCSVSFIFRCSPRTPDFAPWHEHYPAHFAPSPAPEQSASVPVSEDQKREVTIADVGCGFGGLLGAANKHGARPLLRETNCRLIYRFHDKLILLSGFHCTWLQSPCRPSFLKS